MVKNVWKDYGEWKENVVKTWKDKTWAERIVTILTLGLKHYKKYKKGA